jgi:TonB family protein
MGSKGVMISRVRAAKGRETLRRVGSRVLQGVALGLVVVLGLVGRAADERAVKERVAPIYPEIAKRMRVSGVVRLEVTVNAQGKVTDVKTLSGNHMLSMAAEEAVRKWRFATGTGTAVVDQDLNFELGN